ncbi:hypothetical protein [Lentibacillus juripiscarius]|uniref:Uncharacterized protein n=1 Tax=Lentibacillus juripiscarius TaxID=257446 RepID=A0ABW5V3K2_9BACI
MEQNKISLMEAYMIETLRSNGISDDELLTQINRKDISPWKDLSTQFDFSELIKLSEQDEEAFKSIIMDGYKIKFVTFKGLQNLLKLKFNMIQEKDYTLTDKGLTGLTMNDEQLNMLRQMLSSNWSIDETSTENSDHLSKELKVELI